MPLGSEGPNDLLAALSSLRNFVASEGPKQRPLGESSTYERRLLALPEEYHINELYLGVDHRDLIANAGDAVIVHAWINNDAVAYHPGTQTAGQIPRSCLNGTGIKIAVQCDIAVMLGSSSLNGKLHWQVGDRIRICESDQRTKSRGVALNLRTFQIGRYECISDFMRLLKIEESRGDLPDYEPPPYT